MYLLVFMKKKLVKKRNKNPWCTQLQSVGRVLLGLRLLKLLLNSKHWLNKKDSKHNKLFYCIMPLVDHSANGYVIRKFNPKLFLSSCFLQKILFCYTRACDLNLVMISSLASKCQHFKLRGLQFHFKVDYYLVKGRKTFLTS